MKRWASDKAWQGVRRQVIVAHNETPSCDQRSRWAGFYWMIGQALDERRPNTTIGVEVPDDLLDRVDPTLLQEVL